MTGKERLWILVNYLEEFPYPKEYFNMLAWSKPGTPGDAITHAANIPKLAAEGFTMEEYDSWAGKFWIPIFECSEGFAAVSTFFEFPVQTVPGHTIKYDVAYILFLADQYDNKTEGGIPRKRTGMKTERNNEKNVSEIPPKLVAGRIRHYLATDELPKKRSR